MGYKIIRGENEYPIDDGTYCWLTGIEGIGPASMNIITEHGPLQHGSTFVSSMMQERKMTLTTLLQGDSRDDLYYKREVFSRLFSPLNQGFSLRYTPDDGHVSGIRQIDVFPIGDINMPILPRQGFRQPAIVRLLAPDPSWYNPFMNVVKAIPGGAEGFKFNLFLPYTFGAVNIANTVSCTNNGDWIEYPIITLVGPMENPKMVNTRTNEVLDFLGNSVADGDYLRIDLRYGHKTIVDSYGIDRIYMLTDQSYLATWHLEEGSNDIQCFGNNCDPGTSFEFDYYHRYAGI